VSILAGGTYGVMGMLECLRAPRAAPGVREAGDALGLVPSCCLAWSLSSSRRNCELFILLVGERLGQNSAEKLPTPPRRVGASVAFPCLPAPPFTRLPRTASYAVYTTNRMKGFILCQGLSERAELPLQWSYFQLRSLM
jgi:hypothetical protein